MIVMVFVLGCASLNPRPWTKSEKVGAAFFLAGHAADAYTTIRHQDYSDRINEENPALGEHPSDPRVYLYMGATAAVVLLVAHYFPKLRLPLCIGYGGLNLYFAWGNWRLIESVRE